MLRSDCEADPHSDPHLLSENRSQQSSLSLRAATLRSDCEGLGTCSDCKGHLGGCNAAQRL